MRLLLLQQYKALSVYIFIAVVCYDPGLGLAGVGLL